jgi:hypothetical protein
LVNAASCLPVHPLDLQPGQLTGLLNLAGGALELLVIPGRDGDETGEAPLGEAVGELPFALGNRLGRGVV